MSEPASQLHPPTDRPRRILYAEDVRELRDVARMIVAPMGFVLDCAENGQIALERVQADPTIYDLIITDHHMPVMNGLEFVMMLRGLPYAGKVLVFSSDLNPGTAVLYRNLNVDRILNKPVAPQIFRQVVAELVQSGPAGGQPPAAGGASVKS